VQERNQGWAIESQLLLLLSKLVDMEGENLLTGFSPTANSNPNSFQGRDKLVVLDLFVSIFVVFVFVAIRNNNGGGIGRVTGVDIFGLIVYRLVSEK
jgi:hypothetical protein